MDLKNLIPAVMLFFACSRLMAAPVPLDEKKIQELTGLSGQMNAAEGVYKVSFPRSDLHVRAGEIPITAPMGLTSWVAFQAMGDHVMMMGDTDLTEDQVNPVMSAALDNGLEVTALHNHFFGESPKIMFMHISGSGSQEKLAAAVGKVYTVVKASLGAKGKFPTAPIDPAKTKLDQAKLDSTLKSSGTLSGGVFKYTFGRKTFMQEHEVGNAMGVNTWAAFIGTDSQALVDGDFAMLESEVQGVLKKLRGAGINIVAIHNHMTDESPRIVFLHFWGIGPAAELAAGLRGALDSQGSRL
ncbi:MAG: DUF1259 domain-containing protein [Bdellovibrionota bacterium]